MSIGATDVATTLLRRMTVKVPWHLSWSSPGTIALRYGLCPAELVPALTLNDEETKLSQETRNQSFNQPAGRCRGHAFD